jgi:hypothetical protein
MRIVDLPIHSDSRGDLTVVEKILPFEIKRVYFISNSENETRGGHRHIKTIQAAVCVAGSCTIYLHDGNITKEILMDNISKCLIIEPKDFHWMYKFTKDAILVVFASEEFDKSDYINEPY